MTALLTLTHWLSPAFPTGGFAYSHGLEWAIAAGEVRDANDLEHWLSDVLTHGAGRNDACLLRAALDPLADHAALDDLARALCGTAERLTETVDQGAAFARTVSALTGRALPPRALPVAVGEAATRLDLPPETVVAFYLHAMVTTLATGAIRFMPLGQTAGHAVIARLAPVIAGVSALALTLDDLGSAAIGAEIAAMRHETMDVRIFRT